MIPFSNIVLIGMPGAGKSTIGSLLAKEISFHFVDTDLLIQDSQGRLLQEIVDSEGHLVLRQIEENLLSKLNLKNHVIATGGSAVYSHDAMTHLQKNNLILFLRVSLETLKGRINNFATRGLAKQPDQSFEELFEERSGLYHQYANLIVQY